MDNLKIFLEKDINNNAFCIYCKQKRRIHYYQCTKCKIEYITNNKEVISFRFFVSLLNTDSVTIIYRLADKAILFSYNCINRKIYNFQEKYNASFKDFIKEYKKLKKFKKLNLFM